MGRTANADGHSFRRVSDRSYMVVIGGEIVGHVSKHGRSTHPWSGRSGGQKVCDFERTRRAAAERVVAARAKADEEAERDRIQAEREAEEAAKPRQQTRLSEALDAASGLQGDIGQATGRELLDLAGDARKLEDALAAMLLSSTVANVLRYHAPELHAQVKEALVAAGVSIEAGLGPMAAKRPLKDRIWNALERMDRRLEAQVGRPGADQAQAVALVGQFEDAAGAMERCCSEDGYMAALEAARDLRFLRRILESHRKLVG